MFVLRIVRSKPLSEGIRWWLDTIQKGLKVDDLKT